MKKIILTFLLIFGFIYISSVDAAIVIPWGTEIEKVSLDVPWGGNIESSINIIGIELLRVVKRILMWIMVIFIVYTWAMMIMSMWSDEEQLSSAKRQIWYSIVALVFINIPESLYRVFVKDGRTTVWWDISTETFGNESTNVSWNLLVDWIQVGLTINDSIVYFMEIMIFLWAIFMITLAGIQLMTSRGKEDKMKEAKNKIIYTILALIFVGIIEAILCSSCSYILSGTGSILSHHIKRWWGAREKSKEYYRQYTPGNTDTSGFLYIFTRPCVFLI